MNFATQLREFFSILFGSRRIEDLKTQLADCIQQRDAAIAREQRLSLILLTPREPKPTMPRRPVQTVGGRKPWEQIQREDWEQQAEQAKQQAEVKKQGAN